MPVPAHDASDPTRALLAPAAARAGARGGERAAGEAAPTTRARRSTLWREAGHALWVAVGWGGFAWMWIVVGRQHWAVEGLVWLIGGSLLVVPLLTGAWVLHNRAIHRRKGERRAVAVVAPDYTHDWHGRAVHADWAALRRARYIVVGADDTAKRYGRRPDRRAAGPRPAATDAVDTLT